VAAHLGHADGARTDGKHLGVHQLFSETEDDVFGGGDTFVNRAIDTGGVTVMIELADQHRKGVLFDLLTGIGNDLIDAAVTGLFFVKLEDVDRVFFLKKSLFHGALPDWFGWILHEARLALKRVEAVYCNGTPALMILQQRIKKKPHDLMIMRRILLADFTKSVHRKREALSITPQKRLRLRLRW
jgi:hypothetical protein